MKKNQAVAANGSLRLLGGNNRCVMSSRVTPAWTLGALIFFSVPAAQAEKLSPSPAPLPSLELPPALPLPSSELATKEAIRYFTARVKRDPEDARSQSALALYYLERLRETGNEDNLPPALTAAQASLAAVPAEANTAGLAALAQAEFANHDFEKAREHARRLTTLDAGKSEPYAILGDALLELGQYEKANVAFQEMRRLGEDRVGTQTRLARWSFLHGESEQAYLHLLTALKRLLEQPFPPREAVAWCRWQLGEVAFSRGDYATAERCYRDALTTSSGYFRALASLGRVFAGRGDLPAAMKHYNQAIAAVLVPDYMAAIGDIDKLSGQPQHAGVQYELVELLGGHSRAVHGQPHNRQLALFYADHDIKTEEAYTLAKNEYAVRRDIYGADALAWTALKSGRLAEAQIAIHEALRLGTQDAKLLYHAGMIAHAASDTNRAAAYLQRALALNARFDPLQTTRALVALQQSHPKELSSIKGE